jgi:hypothetical protein
MSAGGYIYFNNKYWGQIGLVKTKRGGIMSKTFGTIGLHVM